MIAAVKVRNRQIYGIKSFTVYGTVYKLNKQKRTV